MSEYKGWTLFDKVELVLKRERTWRNGECIYLPTNQAYVVDPSNKSMHESAVHWGTHSICTRDEAGNSVYSKLEPEVITLDNEGFTLTLLEAANGSSQGGKLSFWNCSISKDGQSWKIGIGSDLLCELLKQSTFIDGVCQQKLFFARRNGNVGMLHKDCQGYKDALSDMEKKAAIKSAKKTKKWVQGHNYVTLKEDSMFLYPIYSWVEPIYSSTIVNRFLGYKVLSKPKKLYMTAHTSSVYSCISKYFEESGPYIHIRDTLPSRMPGDIQIKVDMTDDQMDKHLMDKAMNSLKVQVQHFDECRAKNWSYSIYPMQYVGLNTSPTIPPDLTEVKKVVESMKLRFEFEGVK